MIERRRPPAFVMGLGRSGTTFLAKLIDSSPEVLYRHEPDAVLPTDLPNLVDIDDLDRHLPTAQSYLRSMAACRKWQAAGHVPVFRKSYRSRLANLTFLPLVQSARLARKLRLSPSEMIPDLIAGDGKDIVCLIKSVSALGRARLFAEACSSMRSIHIIRHPCAVVASTKAGVEKGVMRSRFVLKSLFAQKQSANYPFSYEQMEKATFEEQAAYRWMLMNDKAAAEMEGVESCLRIRYEDLCCDVDRMSRRVFDHLGIELGAQTRRFIDDVSRPPMDAKAGNGYFTVKRPITSALDKWRTQLAPEVAARIQDIVSHSPLGRAYFERTARPKTTAAAG